MQLPALKKNFSEKGILSETGIELVVFIQRIFTAVILTAHARNGCHFQLSAQNDAERHLSLAYLPERGVDSGEDIVTIRRNDRDRPHEQARPHSKSEAISSRRLDESSPANSRADCSAPH